MPDPTPYTILRDFGYPVFCACALGAWTVWQDKLQRGERAAFLACVNKLADSIDEVRAVVGLPRHRAPAAGGG